MEPADAAGDGDDEAMAQDDAAVEPEQGEAPEDAATAAEAPDGNGNAEDDGGDANADGEPPEAEIAAEKVDEKPVKLGYRTFASGKECFEYFHKLLSKLTPNQDLNEVWTL